MVSMYTLQRMFSPSQGSLTIHFLNGSYNAVDESLNKILNVPKFKDSYEAIKLLARVKIIQNKRYEALALLKRAIELNP